MTKSPRRILLLLATLALAKSIDAAAATVVKSSADQAQTGNHATNAFDADPETRWAASGHGRWIQFEL
ncbi:MAG: hypothetical protein ACI9UA_004833, partial [Pseudoalteromonas tetraodonis]